VYNRVLNQMRARIRARQYVMTVHAEEEMDDDSLSVFDVECAILNGKITGRQRDMETGECKYVMEGKTLGGLRGEIVTKLSITGKLVIITVYCQ
jgi:hypothetical protein